MYAALTEIAYEEEEKERMLDRTLEIKYQRPLLRNHPIWNNRAPLANLREKNTNLPHSTLDSIPPELYKQIFQHLSCDDLMNLRQASRHLYSHVLLSRENKQRRMMENIHIARKVLDLKGRIVLGMKTPMRYPRTRPEDQEVLNITSGCGSWRPREKYWWNYCIRDMGHNERPEDFVCPVEYRNINTGPPVWDIHLALERHMLYFFADVRLRDLRMTDLVEKDVNIINDCLARTMVPVNKVIITMYKYELVKGYMDIFKTARPRAIAISLTDQTIHPSFWTSIAVQKCDLLEIRGGTAYNELTDEVLEKLTASKLHISTPNMITAQGLHKIIDKWYCGERKIKKFFCIHANSNDELREELRSYFKGTQRNSIHLQNKNGSAIVELKLLPSLIIITDLREEGYAQKV